MQKESKMKAKRKKKMKERKKNYGSKISKCLGYPGFPGGHPSRY